MTNKRIFLYEPYDVENGDAVLLYFHKRPENPKTGLDTWDMTGVDVPTKDCPEWKFWRNVQTAEEGNFETAHDLTPEECKEIQHYILSHPELVPNMYLPKEKRIIQIRDNEDSDYFYGYLEVADDFDIESFQYDYNRLRYEDCLDGWEECLEQLKNQYKFTFVPYCYEPETIYF